MLDFLVKNDKLDARYGSTYFHTVLYRTARSKTFHIELPNGDSLK